MPFAARSRYGRAALTEDITSLSEVRQKRLIVCLHCLANVSLVFLILAPFFFFLLAYTVKSDVFCTIWNSSPDSPDGDYFEGERGSGRVFTLKTYGFYTIWNSSPDSPDGDLGVGGVRARFYCESKCFLHNLEFVTGLIGWGF